MVFCGWVEDLFVLSCGIVWDLVDFGLRCLFLCCFCLYSILNWFGGFRRISGGRFVDYSCRLVVWVLLFSFDLGVLRWVGL